MKTTDYRLNHNVRTPMRVSSAAKMKCAALSAVIFLMFVSQTFALLRPLFPAKPTAPLNGELVLGDDLSVGPASKHLPRHRNQVR
jgi:hypothetical protein